jgi:DNA-binding response OmpR family regulator
VVEDDFKIASFIKKGLLEEGYEVTIADNGKQAIEFAQKNNYTIILLDIMLPLMNGIEVCKILRLKEVFTPIILLTARDKLEDKIDGLDSGANDYLTKPFEFKELLARIRAQLRTLPTAHEIIKIQDLNIDTFKREVHRASKRIKLTAKEYALLELLALYKNKLVTGEMILEKLDTLEQSTMSNVVSVYIYRIRNKINKDSEVKLIKTIRGAGYKLMDEDV